MRKALKIRRILPGFFGWLCLCGVFIPYTDLTVAREPKALADHAANPAAAIAAAPIARKPIVVATVAEMELAQRRVRAALQELGDRALTRFYIETNALVNVNEEVLERVLEVLPKVRKVQQRQLLNDINKALPFLPPPPEQELASIARNILLDRMDAKDREQVLAETRAQQRRMLFENLLKGFAMGPGEQPMNMAPMAFAPMAPAPMPMPMDPRWMAMNTAATNPPPIVVLPAAGNQPTVASLFDPLVVPYNGSFGLPNGLSTQSGAAPVNLSPSVPARFASAPAFSSTQSLPPAIAGNPGAVAATAPIMPFGANAGGFPAQVGAASAASVSSTDDGVFQVGQTPMGFVSPKYTLSRGTTYLSSNAGEGGTYSPESDDDSYENSFAPAAASLYSASMFSSETAPSAAKQEPAFSRPMGLTLIGLCSTGALNCDRGKK